MHESDDRDPGRLDEIAELYTDRAPPREMEDRVVARLRQEGALGQQAESEAKGAPSGNAGPGRRRAPRQGTAGAGRAGPLARRAAAAVVLFAGGWLAGSVAAGGARPVEPTHMLLLWEPEGFGADQPAAILADEYAGWARDVASGGVAIDGAELAATSEVVGAAPTRSIDSAGSARLGGFFTIAVADREAALAVAAGHPHIDYGGWLEVAEVVRR